MTTQSNIVELKRLLAVLKAEVELESAASLADLKSAIAEIVLLEPLRVAFELPTLASLNVVEKRNFPAIDLGDKYRRVAFQVTATNDISKIRSTTELFIKHDLHKQYDELYIILLSKSKNYTVDIAALADGKFKFDKDHIIDLDALFAKLSLIEDAAILSRLVQLLQSHLVDGAILTNLPQPSGEKDLLHTNLLPIKIPTYVYSAKLTLDKKKIAALLPERNLTGDKSYVNVVLSHNKSEYPRDFVCRGGELISFRPLAETELVSLAVVDSATIQRSEMTVYSAASRSNSDSFLSLLRTVLQFQLKSMNVFWQHKEKLFAFGSSALDSPRKITWLNRNTSKRSVVALMKSDNEDSPPVYKHFGFRIFFQNVDEHWFAISEPKWLFSKDGYDKSYAHSKLAANTARLERNAQLYQHTRFISWFLSSKLRDDEYTIQFDKNIIVEGKSTFVDTDWASQSETD